MQSRERALPALTHGRSRVAGIPSSRCGFKRARAHGVEGSPASRRPGSLQKRLHSLKGLAGDLPVTGGDYAYAGPRVGPDLRVWAVPRHGEAELSRLGLSLLRNSQNRSRTGLKGITPHGKRQVRDSCRLMEGMKKRCAMWTVTLTDEDYIALSVSRKWPKFQRRVIDLLCRYLKSHGDPAVVIAVCEIGSKRFSRTGRPDPHIHVITTGWGRRHPEGGWLLSPDRMDQLVSQAAQYAGLPLADRRAASSIAEVRHSVASYMSKYLTKEMPVDLDKVEPEVQALVPHQWWNQSAACKALVDGCVFRMPPAFASFIVRNLKLLEGLRLGTGGVGVVGWRETWLGSVPIEMTKFHFKGTEEFQQAMELFVLWVVNGEQLDREGLVLSG